MRFGLLPRVVLFVLLALATSACSTSNDSWSSASYSPPPGPGAFGQSCSKTEDCASLLCVRDDSSGGVCSRSCTTDQDCPAAVNWRCLQPDDLSHPVCACRRDPSQSCLDGVDNDCDGTVDQCQTCNGVSVSVNDPNNCGACGVVCGSNQQCTSGHCGCASKGMTACGTACVDTQNDANNCGACGNACASGKTCVKGVCACADSSRPNACGTLCTSFATDDSNCGSCGTVCPSGTSCSGGSCKCPTSAATNCGGSCVDTGTDPNNCGGCGVTCSTEQSCVNGACTCPASAPKFCGSVCVDTGTDPNNCGSCGLKCNPALSCVNGVCTCPASAPQLCGNVCLDTGTDPENCGGCGVKCSTQQSCVNGACECPASAPQLCGTACVDPSTNWANCGSCGHACDSTQTCVGGACACPSYAPSLCYGACTNTSTDVGNCGACGKACGLAQQCAAGACICPQSGMTACGSACVATATDPSNCGACGNVCVPGESCVAGACRCPSGVMCSGVCESASDPQNCGGCGVVCPQGELCNAGVCGAGELTVNFRAIGAGVSGSISSSPAGISCSAAGNTCTTSAQFPLNATVTLTVSGISTTTLSAWLPSTCSGTTCTVTVSSFETVNYTATGDNIIFTTSQTFSGNMGGLSGATSLCTSAASSAGVPGHYVPWLATSTADATTALGSARGWIRLDGQPFADTIGAAGQTTGMINGQIFYPPRVDEFGALAGIQQYVWTGSNSDGTFSTSGACGDWTSTTVQSGEVGQSFSGNNQWATGHAGPCSQMYGLYCMGTDFTNQVSVSPQAGRLAFVTKGAFNANSGVVAADALCTSEASSAGLANPNNFMALMASTYGSAASRFNAAGANWVRPDGLPLASSPSALFATSFSNGYLNVPLSQHADGSYVNALTYVWTGAANPASTGTAASSCANWTSSTGTGTVGGSDATTQGWWFDMLDSGWPCQNAYPVYCLEN